jgi:hypothetical protein
MVVRQQREWGRNLVRIAELHPETLGRPPVASSAPQVLAAVYDAGLRAAWVYAMLGRTASVILSQRRLGTAGFRRRVSRLGQAAARLAGLIEAGGTPEVVETFGFPRPTSPEATTARQPAED